MQRNYAPDIFICNAAATEFIRTIREPVHPNPVTNTGEIKPLSSAAKPKGAKGMPSANSSVSSAGTIRGIRGIGSAEHCCPKVSTDEFNILDNGPLTLPLISCARPVESLCYIQTRSNSALGASTPTVAAVGSPNGDSAYFTTPIKFLFSYLICSNFLVPV